jgi:hypothetical protein
VASGTLSYAQLKAVWLTAAKGTKYASNAWASLMAAIAEAESSGNPNSTNPTDNGGTQTSWGLWQISLGNHDAPSPNWNDPVVNAQLAIGKLNGQGLTAWGTYTSGAYKTYLNGATTPDAAGIAGGSAATAAYLTSASQTASQCLWSIPSLESALISGVTLGLVGGQGYCVFSRSEARALMGAVFMGAGGLILGVGANAFMGLMALKAAGSVVSAATGGQRTVGRVAGLFGGSAAAGSGAAGGAAAGGAADAAVLAA